MTSKPTLTVIVPAYNEEPTLAAVVAKVVPLAEKYFSNYEIIVVDDASTDRTGKIADGLAVENPCVRPVHNPRNMNLGYNFRKGLELARMEYFSMVPGDDDITEETLERLFEKTDQADFVLAYPTNYEARHPLRRVVSRAFVKIMNFLFGLKVNYYNGPAVFRREILRSVPMTTFGFAYMAEIVVTLLKRGHSYVEVPMTLKPERKGANLRVFRLRNVWSVFKTITGLFWRVRVLNRY